MSWAPGEPSLELHVAPLLENISRVIVGKAREIRLVVACLLSGGHVLLEDVPGVGKTMLARALASSIGGTTRRIQFTPDLLPSDVTGLSVFNQKTGDFDFKQGPVFANVALADEINRANPRTQSALLEAMAEQQVTVDGISHKLPDPFFVIATQNPVELQGTYPLPEAQLDRFLMRVSLGYPSLTEESDIIQRQAAGHPIETLKSVMDPAGVTSLREAVRKVTVKPALTRYIASLAAATRNHADLVLGASPRASLALTRCVQAWAFLNGRNYGTPDDAKALAGAVMSHRLMLSHQARFSNKTAEQLVKEIVGQVPTPQP